MAVIKLTKTGISLSLFKLFTYFSNLIYQKRYNSIKMVTCYQRFVKLGFYIMTTVCCSVWLGSGHAGPHFRLGVKN